MKRTLGTLLLLFIYLGLSAQYYTGHTKNSQNEALLNPAYVAIHDQITISGSLKNQLGQGSPIPSTQQINVFGIMKHYNFGLGFNAVNEFDGENFQRLFSFSYAYRIDKEEREVSFGMNVGTKTFKYKMLPTQDLDSFSQIKPHYEIEVSPVFGLGMHIQGNRYSFDISVPYFFRESVNPQKYQPTNNLVFLQLQGSYLFKGGYDKAFKPFFYLRYGNQVEIEERLEYFAGTQIYINKWWDFGITYLSNEEIALNIQNEFHMYWKLAYTYSVTSSHISENPWGEHILSLAYNIQRGYKIEPDKQRYF